MAFDLTAALERVEELLLDTANVRFSEEEITAAVRLALAELSLAAGEGVALEGLDGALETTFAEHLAHLVALGGAGFAALARAGSRADWELQDAGEFANLNRWAEQRLLEFRALLNRAYPDANARMRDQRRSLAPWAGWADDFGEREEGG